MRSSTTDPRCRSFSPDGRRCQLYASHECDHASAWRDADRARRRTRRSGIPPDSLTVDRWGQGGLRVEQWLDDGLTAHFRLPWCALGYPSADGPPAGTATE
jgi:hypothetical protein